LVGLLFVGPNCHIAFKQSLGYVWIGGEGWMEWNEVGWSHIPLFDFVKKEWNGMGCDGTHSIKYHSFTQFSIPPNLGCIQWN